MIEREETTTCFWREDIDSLAFHPDGHKGLCVIHRRAFRTLLGFSPESKDCFVYFENRRDIFQHAATEKISRARVLADGSFHLNSRDIRQTLALTHSDR